MILLRLILSAPNHKFKLLQLDSRGVRELRLSRERFKYYSYHASVLARLRAELRLWLNTRSSDIVICFHGLPPLLPLKGKVVVFIQNRLLVESKSLIGHPLLTRVRLTVERCWLRFFHSPTHRYIVQTPSMQMALQKLWKDANVSVFPFAPVFETKSIENEFQHGKKFDFLYVASGESHKNHLNLLEAWRILADADLRPSLALTVSSEAFPQLCAKIAKYTKEHSLDITNLNLIEPSKIHKLYQSASALIFPSTTESFGLPLIEAKQLEIPILAAELDYVRDVVEPIETFDPHSPISIARAVKRFLDQPEPTAKIHSAEEFLSEILR
ncbi:glycosyltransferase [Methylophilus sp. QUAN]|uniref:glycosyltransferase n=1 Tax=Methylophilus sp. QUAN TaxID=2781020 RepID=UPI00188F7932|nr:glycosyltransferase [Methylophilus sp. QUAN]MBF4990617.1 glycosyltransferase [Methylophilus sp. QUAN]